MLEIDHVSFAYADAHGHALTDVTLTVNPGERVVVLGANGSGKSTLARVANGSARPLSGSVRVDGEKDGALVRRVGYVRQDPTSQLVSARVFDEVAFGPANLGLTRQEVVSRANEALERCRIEKLADRGTAGLSGGQQQLVAIAGVVAMRPRYLVLDEICSHLDPLARSEVEGLVDSLVSDGVGVLEMAHDVRSVLCATRVVVLDGGCVVWEGTPGELLGPENTPRTALLDDDPCARAISVAARAGADISACADPDALAAFAGAQGLESEVLEALGSREAAAATLAGHVLSLAGATVDYDSIRALDEATFEASCGVTLVAGLSGSGKTTAACALAGVLELGSGAALLDGVAVRPGSVGLAFQRSEDQLFADTVADDIAFGPRNAGAGEAEVSAAVARAAGEMGLSEELLARSPFSLSGGQRRRAALAGLIALDYGAFVFDEPSAGLDARGCRLLRELVSGLAQRGASVVLVTHAVGEWLPVADRVVMLRDGRVASSCDAADAWSRTAPYAFAGLPAPYEVRVRELLGGRSA